VHDAAARPYERLERGRVVGVRVRDVDLVLVEPPARPAERRVLRGLVRALLREQRGWPQRPRVDAEIEHAHAGQVGPRRGRERHLVTACREPPRDVGQDRLGELEDPQAGF